MAIYFLLTDDLVLKYKMNINVNWKPDRPVYVSLKKSPFLSSSNLFIVLWIASIELESARIFINHLSSFTMGLHEKKLKWLQAGSYCRHKWYNHWMTSTSSVTNIVLTDLWIPAFGFISPNSLKPIFGTRIGTILFSGRDVHSVMWHLSPPSIT